MGTARGKEGDRKEPASHGAILRSMARRRTDVAADGVTPAENDPFDSRNLLGRSPHRVDGRLYVDGGMWSATSVDAAAEADQVIVVAPLAGSVLGPMGRTAGLLLERELGRWRTRHPDSEVYLIRPNKEIARLAGRNPLGLFDEKRARGVYQPAYEQGLRWGERIGTGTQPPQPERGLPHSA